MEINEETINRESKIVNDILCNLTTETSVILKKSFESQVNISRKIIRLEEIFKELKLTSETPNYKETFNKLHQIKKRVKDAQKRINDLDKRLNNVEYYLHIEQ